MNAVLNNLDTAPNNVLNKILRILFPIKCLGCGLIHSQYICSDCKRSLKETKPECFVTRNTSINWDIELSQKDNTAFEKVYYFYTYDEILHNLMLDIKYRFHKDKLSEIFNLIIRSKEFQSIDFKDIDLITFVPISDKRMKWRGFNQSQHLASFISKITKKPFCQLLVKSKNTTAQIKLTREERLLNLENTFNIKSNLPLELNSQTVLLVDDICTTGSTLEECARTIKRDYPEIKVYGLCLGRGEKC